MGNIRSQIEKEYTISKSISFYGGTDGVYEVYTGSKKTSSPVPQKTSDFDSHVGTDVSIWICSIKKLKKKYGQSQWKYVYDCLIKELTFLEELKNPDNKEFYRNGIGKRHFLEIKQKFEDKNELIFISEPIICTLQDVKRNFFESYDEFKMKLCDIFDGINSVLHGTYGVNHYNISKENILLRVSDAKKYIKMKLFGFQFMAKRKRGKSSDLNALTMYYQKLMKYNYKPTYLNNKSYYNSLCKSSMMANNVDLDQFYSIVTEYFGPISGKISIDLKIYKLLNTPSVLILKKIIEKESKINNKFVIIDIDETPKGGMRVNDSEETEFNSFLSLIYESTFSKYIFLNYIKLFLAQNLNRTKSVPMILKIFFKYIPYFSKEEFLDYIMPAFKNVFKLLRPVSIPLLLLKPSATRIDMLLEYSRHDKNAKKNVNEKSNAFKKILLQFLSNCLNVEHSVLQIEAVSVIVQNFIKGRIEKDKYFMSFFLPKIIILIKETKFLSVKLNCIVQLNNIVRFLSQNKLVQLILPILKYSLLMGPINSNIIMAIVKTYANVAKRINNIHVLSSSIIPNVTPLLTKYTQNEIGKGEKEKIFINRKNFMVIFQVVNELTNRIREEKLKYYDKYDLYMVEEEKRIRINEEKEREEREKEKERREVEKRKKHDEMVKKRKEYERKKELQALEKEKMEKMKKIEKMKKMKKNDENSDESDDDDDIDGSGWGDGGVDMSPKNDVDSNTNSSKKINSPNENLLTSTDDDDVYREMLQSKSSILNGDKGDNNDDEKKSDDFMGTYGKDETKILENFDNMLDNVDDVSFGDEKLGIKGSDGMLSPSTPMETPIATPVVTNNVFERSPATPNMDNINMNDEEFNKRRNDLLKNDNEDEGFDLLSNVNTDVKYDTKLSDNNDNNKPKFNERSGFNDDDDDDDEDGEDLLQSINSNVLKRDDSMGNTNVNTVENDEEEEEGDSLLDTLMSKHFDKEEN